MAAEKGHARAGTDARVVAQVVWTRRALSELQAIEAYIAQFSPQAAQQFSVRLFQAGASLRDQPERGRPIAGARRELTIVAPSLIRYRVRQGVVQILTLRHGSRAAEP